MPSKISTILQTAAVLTGSTIGGFYVWTKHCHFEPINKATDKTFNSSIFAKYNPNKNPVFSDECVRKIALTKIKPEFIDDAKNGGSKMVENFCAGIWSGYGYTIQRKYLERKYRNDTTTVHQLWDVSQLRESTYPVGTEITDHFVVLDKTPTTILIRCGDSPLVNPDKARPSDGLFEISARADLDHGYAEFKLKSIFYQGEGKAEKAPFSDEPLMDWLHKQYTKLWMEEAMKTCVA